MSEIDELRQQARRLGELEAQFDTVGYTFAEFAEMGQLRDSIGVRVPALLDALDAAEAENARLRDEAQSLEIYREVVDVLYNSENLEAFLVKKGVSMARFEGLDRDTRRRAMEIEALEIAMYHDAFKRDHECYAILFNPNKDSESPTDE